MKVALSLLLTLVFLTDTFSLAAGPIIDPDFAARMNRLEAETQALRAELQQLRQQPVRLPPIGATPVSMTALAVDDDGDYYTWEELQAEMKRNTWKKGDFKVIPYGFLWGNMVYETARSAPLGRSFTAWVRSPDEIAGSEFLVDARGTRFGLDIAGPRLAAFGCAKSGGKVEIDFQGAFAGTENKGGVLLRQAYWEIKNDQYRLLFGQAWDIVSPLYPTTTTYSIYWWAGNIGYRRAQLRYERYLSFSDTFLLTLQGSLNQNILIGNDLPFLVFNAERDAGSWPVLEARTSVTWGDRGPHGLPWTFGISGHIGSQRFNTFNFFGTIQGNAEYRRTWSINADVKMPITDRFGFKCELFHGENLSAFLGGIGQGLNVDGDTVRTTGGWMELYYYWTSNLHSHVGYGLDDPRDGDLVEDQWYLPRTYNQFVFGNILWDVTSKFRMGFEVTSWKTLYLSQRPGESVRCEFMGKYAF